MHSDDTASSKLSSPLTKEEESETRRFNVTSYLVLFTSCQAVWLDGMGKTLIEQGLGIVKEWMKPLVPLNKERGGIVKEEEGGGEEESLRNIKTEACFPSPVSILERRYLRSSEVPLATTSLLRVRSELPSSNTDWRDSIVPITGGSL